MKGPNYLIQMFLILLLSYPGLAYSEPSEIECEARLEQHFKEWLNNYRHIQDVENLYAEADSKIEILSQFLSEFDFEPCSEGTKLVFNKTGFEIKALKPELKAIIELKRKSEKGELFNGQEIYVEGLYDRWRKAIKPFEDHLIATIRHFRTTAWLRRRS